MEAFADDIDAGNEQSHQHWIERYQQARAIELANARQDERRKVIKELIESGGDAELRNFPGRVLQTTRDGIDESR
jgi:hypothetical protein